MSDPTITVCTYSEDGEMVDDVELEYTDVYYSDSLDESDYIQFAGLVQGKHVELRLYRKDLPFLTNLK